VSGGRGKGVGGYVLPELWKVGRKKNEPEGKGAPANLNSN